MQYPTVNDEPKTVQAYGNMLSSSTIEHNPIGSTREQQIIIILYSLYIYRFSYEHLSFSIRLQRIYDRTTLSHGLSSKK